MKRFIQVQQDMELVNGLLDTIMKENSLKNDAALCRFLGWTPPTVCKVRGGSRIGLSGGQVIDIHLATAKPVVDIINAVNLENRNG